MQQQRNDQKSSEIRQQKLGLLINLLVTLALGGLVFFLYFFTEAPKSKSAGPIKRIGYITAFHENGGKTSLDIDYIQWFTGEEAKKAEFEDGKSPCKELQECAPNGFYILNTNDKIRNYDVSPNVEITMQTFSHAEDGNFNYNQKITFDEFKKLFAEDEKSSLSEPYKTPTDSPYRSIIPFWIEIEGGMEALDGQGGEVVKITEQYIP